MQRSRGRASSRRRCAVPTALRAVPGGLLLFCAGVSAAQRESFLRTVCQAMDGTVRSDSIGRTFMRPLARFNLALGGSAHIHRYRHPVHPALPGRRLDAQRSRSGLRRRRPASRHVALLRPQPTMNHLAVEQDGVISRADGRPEIAMLLGLARRTARKSRKYHHSTSLAPQSPRLSPSSATTGARG